MELLLVHVSSGARGLAKREERRLTGNVFQIGRGAQCEIHLPDTRVALVHARLLLGERGPVIEAEPRRIVYNDREVSGAELRPGDHIEIGPYVLSVETPPPGVSLAIAVRVSKRVSTSGTTALYRALLRGPGVSKRRLSYLVFFGVLALCLGAPLADRLAGGGMLPRALSLGAMQAWNPGPLARAHAVFGRDCHSCHARPFVPVAADDCLACHGAIRAHGPKEAFRAVSFAAGHALTCMQCHQEHQGGVMAPRAPQVCAQCHGGSRRTAAGVEPMKATDFASDHPGFRLALLDPARPGALLRVAQRDASGAAPREHSNLKFNHTLHLDPLGVRGPRKVRTTLNCASCHVPAEGGARMRPVSMERDCVPCHSLQFDPASAARQVPHSSIEEVRTMLREFYARSVLADAPAAKEAAGMERRRPGAVVSPEERRAAARLADEKASGAMRELLETRKVCSTCHYISRTARGDWQLAPVALSASWMPGALFDHAKHLTEPCITCHEVRSSRRAEDIAMPDITRCRDCHGGAAATPPKVASDCASCHRFHGGTASWRELVRAPE